MKLVIDKNKFGPWALVTGASTGIGKEFAAQLAADGLNLVLVARRIELLNDIGAQLSKEFGIKFRAIKADLSEESAVKTIIDATEDLEIGLLISNAGTGNVGKFFTTDESALKYILHLNAISHLSLTHYFGSQMADRRKGGVLLVGAMGAAQGIPYMANEAGTKGYIQSLGKSLHVEFREFGLHITVLVTTPTETQVFYKLGFTKKNTPMLPISVEQCVREALQAFSKNKITVLPGFKFRVIKALVPGSIARKMTGKIIKKNNNLS